MTPWQVLGIEPTPDERDIKRAYAKRLKQTRPDEDKEGFLKLREAYERALELRRQVAAVPEPIAPSPDAVADETAPVNPAPLLTAESLEQPAAPFIESKPQPLPEPEEMPSAPPPIRLNWTLNPAAPPPPVAPLPRTRADYRRGWKNASRQSESALIRQIEEDLATPALVHLEARANYERDLLAWLLKHRQAWPGVLQMTQGTLHWQEKQQLWPEWPWSQLDHYARRCRLHAFFKQPGNFREESPVLCEWLMKSPVTAPQPPRRYLPVLLLRRADLNRELGQFRAAYGDLLQYEPEGNTRLEALEQILKRFPMEKAVGLLTGLFLGGGLMPFSVQEGDRTLMFLFSLAMLGLALFTAYGLARDFVAPGFRKLLRRVLLPPSTLAITTMLILGLVTGIPSALLWWKMPHLAEGLHGWLEVSGSLLMVAAAMLWNRLSDMLAVPSPELQRWLESPPIPHFPWGLVVIGIGSYAMNAEFPVYAAHPWLRPAVGMFLLLPAAALGIALRIHHRFGPGIPRRFLAYLALAISDTALLLLNDFHKGDGDKWTTLMVVMLLLVPLVARTGSGPRTAGDRGLSSLFLIGLFLMHQIFYGIMAWTRFGDGHLTGLAGLLMLIYIPFYILAHDPKQD